jgi:hypothetical protein
MSNFVNFKKRDVGLPANCKDLMDLLRRQGDRDIRLADFEVARDEVLTGALCDVEVHIQAFCKFRGPLCDLHIREPDDQITVWFKRRVYDEIEGSISIPPGSPHQQAIRSFLKSRRLEWPEDCEFPKTVYPAIPVQIFQDLTPLPTDPAALSRLAMDFFLHLGLEDRSSVQYSHFMIAKKG